MQDFNQEFKIALKIPKKLKSYFDNFWHWILKYIDTWFRKCARYELILETCMSKMCWKYIMKRKNEHFLSKNAEKVNSWRWTKNSHLKSWQKGKGFSWDIQRKETVENYRKFSSFVRQVSKGFKEKDDKKNAWDKRVTALEFIQTGNCFYFDSFISFFWNYPIYLA